MAQVQGTVVRAHPGIGVLKLQLSKTILVGEAVETLYRSGTVDYAETNYRIDLDAIPTDPMFSDQWALNNTGQGGGTADADIDAVEAWNKRTNCSNTIVAVIDTGVGYNHEDLAANMWKNLREIPGNGVDDDHNGWVDDVYGINAVAENGDPFDDDLHGTHCAGIIRAKGNKGVGVTGVCWAAKIMALKFIGIDGYGYIDDAITCIGYALAMKAKNSYPCMVLSNSWGSYWKSQAPYDAFKATQLAGVLVVAAAGNDGLDNDA